MQAIGCLSKGGAEFQCRQLANGLDPERYDASILYLHEGPDADLLPHVRKLPVNRGSWADVPAVWRQISSIMRDEEPDIVQTWLPEIVSVPVTVTARQMKIPLVTCLRGSLNFNGGWDKYIRDRLQAPKYLFADRIVSNYGVDEEPTLFKWLYRRKQGVCILNGLNLEALRSMLPRKLPCSAKYQILVVGRIIPSKGLPTALRAVRILANDLDLHFTIIGEGQRSYVDSLKKLAGELGIADRVSFLGAIWDWQAYAKDVDCMVAPTISEGTSNVILEALAVGMPVVISDIPMTRQLLTHRVNAQVVGSRNPKRWADAIREVLINQSLRERLRSGGMARADQFGLSAMVSAYEAIYWQLVA